LRRPASKPRWPLWASDLNWSLQPLCDAAQG
jgi:hypothetical protein